MEEGLGEPISRPWAPSSLVLLPYWKRGHWENPQESSHRAVGRGGQISSESRRGIHRCSDRKRLRGAYGHNPFNLSPTRPWNLVNVCNPSTLEEGESSSTLSLATPLIWGQPGLQEMKLSWARGEPISKRKQNTLKRSTAGDRTSRFLLHRWENRAAGQLVLELEQVPNLPIFNSVLSTHRLVHREERKRDTGGNGPRVPPNDGCSNPPDGRGI